jgi:hypothetical protein
MAITRSQIARQLMQEGGVPRQGYFLGKLVRKIKDDIIPNELKSPAGAAAAAALASYGLGRMQPGADNRGIFGNILEGGKRVLFGKKPNIVLNPTEVEQGAEAIYGDREGGLFGGIKKAGGAAAEAIMKPRFPNPNQKDTEPQSIGDRILSGIFGGPGLALASGLLAGAFTKDKEDPIYTGQDVGLNLQDIGKLANITDPRVGQAIGLRFLPDVEARKFTPEQMAETFAANQPVEFTEKREQAQDGGMMGDQKDFEEFLQDMQDRDNQMLQDRIMRDFEEFMKRKRMIEQMPEAKDGGIMKMKDGGLTKYEISSLKGLGYDTKGGTVLEPFGGLKVLRDILKVNKMAEGGIASMADGGMMDMGGMEMDLRGGGFVPMGRAEKADDVPARLSKNEFVFTADAVRAAGGGDVNKGADKMYATMKKLEDRVA